MEFPNAPVILRQPTDPTYDALADDNRARETVAKNAGDLHCGVINVGPAARSVELRYEQLRRRVEYGPWLGSEVFDPHDHVCTGV
jgi:hypothetical protein